ncbi:siderophore-interacting protein [Jatrophihabitans sp. YIM 134969]
MRLALPNLNAERGVSLTATSTRTEPAYRVFETRVSGVTPLTPHFVRVTVTGDDLDDFADHGDDQRFKLVLPLPGRGLGDFPRTGEDWYLDWRHLAPERQNPIRTYTVAGVRPARREVDVVMVRHGATGPASAWVETVTPGDPVLLVGPNARSGAPTRAAEWAPPAEADLLVAGDETAVPAIVSILAGLSPDRCGVAVLEVPTSEDVLPVQAPAGVEVVWLGRDGRPHGSLLDAAVRTTAARLVHTTTNRVLVEDTDHSDDDDLLWDVASAADGFYAWLAGEAGTIRTLRRHLVGEVGLDKRAVTFMGYWRRGASEAT